MPWPGMVKTKVFGVFQEPRCSFGMESRSGMPWEVAGPTGVRVMPSRKGETAMVAGSMVLTLGSIAPARVSGFKQTTSERSFSVSLTPTMFSAA